MTRRVGCFQPTVCIQHFLLKRNQRIGFCSDKNNLNESYFAVFRIVAATRTCKIDKKTKNLIRGQIAGNPAFFPGG